MRYWQWCQTVNIFSSFQWFTLFICYYSHGRHRRLAVISFPFVLTPPSLRCEQFSRNERKTRQSIALTISRDVRRDFIVLVFVSKFICKNKKVFLDRVEGFCRYHLMWFGRENLPNTDSPRAGKHLPVDSLSTFTEGIRTLKYESLKRIGEGEINEIIITNG